MQLKNIILLLICLSNSIFADTNRAIFAGGCFWCVEADFAKLPGVTKITVGYDGGTVPKNPSYKLVSSGTTDYVESAMITFDPKIISYSEILNYFWMHIDPTSKDGQFCDRGRQYRSVIFYLDAEQRAEALKSLATVRKLMPVVYTDISPSTNFYPAEEYHQQYYLKHKFKYKFYRYSCGRDKKVQEVWHDKNLH